MRIEQSKPTIDWLWCVRARQQRKVQFEHLQMVGLRSNCPPIRTADTVYEC